jgi:hypothetical protein
MATTSYDRKTQNVGNMLALEHVNVTVPDQGIATLFYLMGLGFTRDPYMTVGVDNMWVNLGRQQFHLPTRPDAQVVPGHIGIVVPDIDALRQRLRTVEPRLTGTEFAWSDEDGYVAVTCPWGNRFRCYAPAPQFGEMVLGMPYVEFPVRPGTAAGIARFYERVMGCPAEVSGGATSVETGRWQTLRFVESDAPERTYDGHHVAVYLSNFSKPYEFLQEKGLITEETDANQYRFQDLVDPENGEHLFTLEHEVRSLYHPMYGRNLVNRNSAQRLGGYTRDADVFQGA